MRWWASIIINGMVYIDGKTDPSGKSQTSIFIQCSCRRKNLIDFEYLVKDMDITDAAGYINDSRDTLIFRALTG
jgi:signal peptidase I